MSSSRTDQLIEVSMPKMGISVSEGTILEWRKQPGDWIEADETIADVTTDKVDVEIPAPASGRLARIIAEPGDTVPVGEPIAEIDAEAKPGEAHPEESAVRSQQSAEPEEAAVSSPQSAEPRKDSGGEPDRSGFVSPVVRRIADKHGVDLEQVEGTGVGGRVRKKDVLAHIESAEGAAAEGSPQPALHTESPYRHEEAGAPATDEPAHAVRVKPVTVTCPWTTAVTSTICSSVP